MLFQDALTARLDIIQPSKSDLTRYLEERDQRVDATPRFVSCVVNIHVWCCYVSNIMPYYAMLRSCCRILTFY